MSDDVVSEDDATPAPSVPRREFLKASAAAAGATLLSSCNSGADSDVEIAAASDPVSRFDHTVVLMFENRSIDNTLGYLYPDNPLFHGLTGADTAQPVPSYIGDGHAFVSSRPSPGTNADYQNPNPDPGEPFPHVNTQLFGLVDPETNRFETAAQMKAPFNTPPAGTVPTLKGFVQDYCNTYTAAQGRKPTFDEYRVIMDSFTPAQLPVLSTLAQSFAVYDAWFCSVPSQTYCNRSFFHASTSSGFLLNAPHSMWIKNNNAPTVFNRLQEAGRTWRVYYDFSQLVSLTGLIHASVLAPYFKTHFRSMETFYADVANGTLPDYAFVEPRMLFAHNDMHPPGPLSVGKLQVPDPSDVRAGDLLLHNVYTAIRNSASPAGSNATNTMFLVTFDEHGGCYDHVAPPPAVTPDNPQAAGQMGFFFDRLGLRVATLAISAYTAANTIVNRPINHAALVRTLSRKYGLRYLTERDRRAPDLSDAVNLTTPRAPSTWPITKPQPVPPIAAIVDPTSPELSSVPLTDLGRNIAALALAYFTGEEPPEDAIPRTNGEAYALLAPLAAGAFGT